MQAHLKISSGYLAFSDSAGVTNDPQKRNVDWNRTLDLPAVNPKCVPLTVDPNGTLTVFNNVRSTSLDNTTSLTLSLSTLASNRYRVAWLGVGTAPAFRTDRGLTCATHTMTCTANANQTLTMTSSTTGDFAAVQAGDTLLIPGVSTGDSAGPFNSANEGYWTVLSKDGTSTTLQLARPTGAAFSGLTESPVVASNPQLVAFSSTGVQVNDRVTITAGFAAAVQSSYTIAAVTSTYFEFVTTAALPVSQTALPGTTGIVFYNVSKRLVHVEADQQCLVRLNGDSGSLYQIIPWSPGDPDQMGEFTINGNVWRLDVVNQTSTPANTVFITAE